MEKIPTIFDRDERFRVKDSPRAGTEWVFAGEGRATEKIDGTNVKIGVAGGRVVAMWKRRNPSKAEKAAGIEPGYVGASEADPADKWIVAAILGTDVSAWPDGEWPSEAIGPKIQGNPLGVERHHCVRLADAPVYPTCPRDFEGLRVFLATLDSLYSHGHLAEGIVFHLDDGRMAKIKRKDFPRP